ncbi:D-alanyl-lipoteichoic acid acyltransferase DltB (MBOAT superfamily) [Martelella radicis]|uniref:D-alanyl-lipoteichoic acid acyltransferase DltB (MBOAT superfamily) n=1 Tax=Martelella radicis TaxID=1397476 RepID=A0A7W6KJ95_9HYPH|nr:D-alanyl-lipoteichoic acid acyltransferase DltB (MBOAT superfamily) [Martelella radicis]
MFLLFLALSSWAALIGLSEGGSGRFDLVHADVRFVEAVLSVLYPVAAAGLWFGVGWGFVLWVLGAAVQIGAHSAYPHIFGDAPGLAALHILLIGFYVSFWVYLAFIRQR